MKEILLGILNAASWTMEAPEMFSAGQIIMSLSAAVCGIFLYLAVRNRPAEKLHGFLKTAGIVFLCAECFRQLFLYFVMFDETYNWFYFPFQLCSMPMYLCLLVRHEKLQPGIYAFLSSYGLIAAVCALMFPEDMLKPYVVITFISFAWHGLMITAALVSARLCRIRGGSFLQALLIFAVCAVAASAVNILSYPYSSGMPADMFYISPYTYNTQPFFGRIAKAYGKIPESILYLCLLSLSAKAVYETEKQLHK